MLLKNCIIKIAYPYNICVSNKYNTVNLYGMLVHVPKLTVNVFPNPNIELSQQYQSNGDDQSKNESYGTVGKVGASVKSTCLDVDRRKKTPG